MNQSAPRFLHPSDIVIVGMVAIAIMLGGASQFVIAAWVAVLVSFAATGWIGGCSVLAARGFIVSLAVMVAAAIAWQASLGVEARELFYTGNLLLPLAAQWMRLRSFGTDRRVDAGANAPTT